MQSPSSLIFLVLLGVWAAYFVQYWVRRRDHLATARSVEQFTAAMRVLERRDPLPGADLSEPAPRSYAVHPARSVRPQVLVKRAEAAHPAAVGVTERVQVDVDPPRSARREAPTATATASPRSARRDGSRPAARPPARRRVRPSRRVRGLLFLTALLGLLVVGVLVALSVLLPVALAPAGVAVVGAFLWVRSGVRAEAALARAHRMSVRTRRAAAAPTTSRGSAGAVIVPVARGGRVEAAHDGSVTSSRNDEAVVDERSATPAVTASRVAGTQDDTGDPADGAADRADPAQRPAADAATVLADDVMVPIMDEDDMPLTWDPVPVPRPTYTMKAKAERPDVEPAAVTPDPAPVARDTERDGTAYEEERRVAGA
ncbi:MAG TPA: hypothetical protein VFN34_11875 [Ornithinibacter sp.]|nr:hypothetical protein [Ornithinibacter sp.]